MTTPATSFIAETYDDGEYEYDAFDAYADAVAFVNDKADEWQENGLEVSRGWASKDNMYAVHVSDTKWGQVIRDEADNG